MSKIVYAPKEKIDSELGFGAVEKIWADHRETILQQNNDAIARGDLLGRLLSHPYADGAAYYIVTKVNKKTAKIHVVSGIGDDWVLPAWGEEISLPINLVKDFLYGGRAGI